jgi:hypothetical protein
MKEGNNTWKNGSSLKNNLIIVEKNITTWQQMREIYQ